MNPVNEKDIVSMVYRAKESSIAANDLVQQYMPFISAETAKAHNLIPQESREDALSIAMFAFHEAVMNYSKEKGAFLPFASRAIKNRIIDFFRKEKRHLGHISLDSERDSEDDRSVLETLDRGEDNISAHHDKTSARQEIMEYAETLLKYGLNISEVADNCPKQERTVTACHRALAAARKHPELIKALTESGKLPITQLALASGVERKTLERHRKYMVAIMLAYTNGFEIIRGHITEMSQSKGETV